MQGNIRYCCRCGLPLAHPNDRFCVHCGESQEPFVPVAPPKPQKPGFAVSFFKGVAYVALFFVIQLVVTFVGEAIIATGLGNIGVSGDEFVKTLYSEFGKWSWLFGIIEAVLLFSILGVFFAVRRKSLAKEIRLTKASPAVLGGSVICGAGAQFAAVILLTVLYALMPFLAAFSVGDELADMMQAPSPILDFLYIAVVTPLMEETIFRGLVYTRLRRSMSAGAAILLSGIIFGAAHLNFEQFLYAAPLGMLMAAVFEKYGSLLVPFAIHFAFNGGNYLAGYLPEKPEMLVPAIAIIGTGCMLISVAFMLCTEKNTSPAHERNSNHEAL